MEGKTARERFKLAVRQAGGSAKAAVRLECTRSYVDMIIKGDRRPGMRTAHAIERVFQIRMQDWIEQEPTANG